jgi:hypothetical protein
VELQFFVRRNDPGGRPGGDPLGEDVADGSSAGVTLQHSATAYLVLVPIVLARVEQLHVGVVDYHGALQASCQVVDQLLNRMDTHGPSMARVSTK